MSTRTKATTKSLAFFTRATESRDDPYWEGEYPVYRWSVHAWGVREDGSLEDPSYYISKIIYDLHSSFPRPRRSYRKAPYCVREKGWGEFDIAVEVHFRDSQIPPFYTTVPLVFEPETQRIPVNLPPFKGSIGAEFKALLASGVQGKDAWKTKDDLRQKIDEIARDPEALRHLLAKVEKRVAEDGGGFSVQKMASEGFVEYFVKDISEFVQVD
jgi:hypothetical protein